MSEGRVRGGPESSRSVGLLNDRRSWRSDGRDGSSRGRVVDDYVVLISDERNRAKRRSYGRRGDTSSSRFRRDGEGRTRREVRPLFADDHLDRRVPLLLSGGLLLLLLLDLATPARCPFVLGGSVPGQADASPLDEYRDGLPRPVRSLDDGSVAGKKRRRERGFGERSDVLDGGELSSEDGAVDGLSVSSLECSDDEGGHGAGELSGDGGVDLE